MLSLEEAKGIRQILREQGVQVIGRSFKTCACGQLCGGNITQAIAMYEDLGMTVGYPLLSRSAESFERKLSHYIAQLEEHSCSLAVAVEDKEEEHAHVG